MAVGDIYQVKFSQQYLGEEMLNVFYYEQATGNATAPAADLVEAIQHTSGWLEEWAALQLEDVTYNYISAVNGMNNADQAIDFSLSPAGGAIDSESAVGVPSLLAMGFRSNRNGYATRYSYKRLGGFPAYFLTDNEWSGAAEAAGDALATALETYPSWNSKTFKPVQITGGFRAGVTPTKTFDLTDWVLMGTPSTQTTRKQGRGS